MKKVLGLIVAMMLVTSVSSAAAANAANAGKWQMQLGAGIDILASNFNTANYSLGIGGDIGGGYAVNENLSFWLNLTDYYLLSNTTGYSTNLVETILSAKYAFGNSSVKPYIAGGLGIFTQIYSSGGASLSASDFMLQGKLGLQFEATKKMSIYVEGKGGIILASTPSGTVTAVDIPINAGVIFDL